MDNIERGMPRFISNRGGVIRIKTSGRIATERKKRESSKEN